MKNKYTLIIPMSVEMMVSRKYTFKEILNEFLAYSVSDLAINKINKIS